MLAVHLTGTFLVCRATLPRLRAAGGGSIVNVASTAALLARPNLGAYAAAKGGIISFSGSSRSTRPPITCGST